MLAARLSWYEPELRALAEMYELRSFLIGDNPVARILAQGRYRSRILSIRLKLTGNELGAMHMRQSCESDFSQAWMMVLRMLSAHLEDLDLGWWDPDVLGPPPVEELRSVLGELNRLVGEWGFSASNEMCSSSFCGRAVAGNWDDSDIMGSDLTNEMEGSGLGDFIVPDDEVEAGFSYYGASPDARMDMEMSAPHSYDMMLE